MPPKDLRKTITCFVNDTVEPLSIKRPEKGGGGGILKTVLFVNDFTAIIMFVLCPL